MNINSYAEPCAYRVIAWFGVESPKVETLNFSFAAY